MSPPSASQAHSTASSAQLPLREGPPPREPGPQRFPVGKSRGTGRKSGQEVEKKWERNWEGEEVQKRWGRGRKGGVTGDESTGPKGEKEETVERREKAGSDHCHRLWAPGPFDAPFICLMAFQEDTGTHHSRRRK